MWTMVEAGKEIRDKITGAGVEEAIIRFFDEVDLAKPGLYLKGNKRIEVIRDGKKKILSATATVNGIIRAIIKGYYDHVYATYFRLQGEEDVNGERDDVVYNRGIYGGGDVKLFRGPGLDLSTKELARTQAERIEIASRLGIEWNVPPPLRLRIFK